MGKPVLLLRLEGPLQSWGVRARWDVRDTQAEPTKSGVIGLLGCALGYPVGDARLEALDAGLRFGVRVEAPGRVMLDYHTVSGFLPTAEGTYRHSGLKTATSLERLGRDPDATPATIISPRYYLEDAAFLVALEETERGAGLLTTAAGALGAPAWPLYLGRKACIPTRPILETLTQVYSGIEEALTRHPWDWRGSAHAQRKSPPSFPLQAFIEDPVGDLVRQDALRVNLARQYAFRHCRCIHVNPPQGGTAVGGNG